MWRYPDFANIKGVIAESVPNRTLRARASPYAWIRDQALASKPSLGASLTSRRVAFRPSEGAFGDPVLFELMATERTPQAETCCWATSPRSVGEGLSFNGGYG